MIVFGWGKKTVRNFGKTIPMKCGNCTNEVYYELVRIKKWVTLFFIPVIPYSSKYYLLCGICTNGISIKGQKIKIAKELATVTKSFLDKQISAEDYTEHLEASQLLA